jgi:dsDNA-specific endonuclease/ATPase MutS2
MCIEKNWNLEVVDESKTSRGLLRHNHSISALRIASISGIRVWELREINPLPGQIKEIQRQSRKLSKGKLTISYEQAELVAKGEASLNDIIENKGHSSDE